MLCRKKLHPEDLFGINHAHLSFSFLLLFKQPEMPPDWLQAELEPPVRPE